MQNMDAVGFSLVITTAIVSGTTLLAHVAVLRLCRFIVRETKDTSGLRDIAVVLRAFGTAYAGRAAGLLPRRDSQETAQEPPVQETAQQSPEAPVQERIS